MRAFNANSAPLAFPHLLTVFISTQGRGTAMERAESVQATEKSGLQKGVENNGQTGYPGLHQDRSGAEQRRA